MIGNMVLVESSNINKVGFKLYEDVENGDLFVEYKSGTKYSYKNVPIKKYHEFIAAESKGRYMNSEIKNKYKYERIN